MTFYDGSEGMTLMGEDGASVGAGADGGRSRKLLPPWSSLSDRLAFRAVHDWWDFSRIQ